MLKNMVLFSGEVVLFNMPDFWIIYFLLPCLDFFEACFGHEGGARERWDIANYEVSCQVGPRCIRPTYDFHVTYSKEELSTTFEA